jgi:[pyruvate, water dikinase]-phosphate phosphotransferase / [pyruvate, water dikinase] kinase
MSDEVGTSPMHKIVQLYLVSHASGELVEMLARNAVAQLQQVEVKRRLWKMVRHMSQLPEILAEIATAPGFVLHSVSHADIREALEEGCRHLKVPFQFALEPMVTRLSQHFDLPVQSHMSMREIIDDDYYQRVEAMKYTITHDDGVAVQDLDDADVVLVGVSRATKTPTCMYLASRGVKAANVPLVPGVPLPENLLKAKRPFIVGLTVDPERLARIRAARLAGLRQHEKTDYADVEMLKQEVQDARRLFARRGWPVIDVSQRSIEQTADMIIRMMKKRAEQSSSHSS